MCSMRQKRAILGKSRGMAAWPLIGAQRRCTALAAPWPQSEPPAPRQQATYASAHCPPFFSPVLSCPVLSRRLSCIHTNLYVHTYYHSFWPVMAATPTQPHTATHVCPQRNPPPVQPLQPGSSPWLSSPRLHRPRYVKRRRKRSPWLSGCPVAGGTSVSTDYHAPILRLHSSFTAGHLINLLQDRHHHRCLAHVLSDAANPRLMLPLVFLLSLRITPFAKVSVQLR